MEVLAMRIRAATDLGAFIRGRRTELGMDQSAAATVQTLIEGEGLSHVTITRLSEAIKQGRPPVSGSCREP
jgi:hypothetical protein